MARPAHILLAVAGAAAAGAIWAGIAGFLKATTGAHEVITTIMLNWIAYWIGVYVFQQGGPLQGARTSPLDIPISGDVVPEREAARLLGRRRPPGPAHRLLRRDRALVVFWLILNRTTLGYEVRAVGYNPDAAAYGGIKVRTNYLRAMAISGAFAGLAGGLDMLGYLYHFGTTDVQATVDRLPRNRRRAARPQHGPRRRHRGASSSAVCSTAPRTVCSRARSTRASPAT